MTRQRLFLGFVVLLALALIGCRLVGLTRVEPKTGTVRPPTATEPTAWPPTAIVPTARPCPQATPELLSVEPVTSPTDQLSQVVTVRLGNAEVVTITAESGTFIATGFPAQVEVALLPNTAHHLEVVGKVREIRQADGCVFGGYTLRTQRDKNGAPLVIQQGQPGLPSKPTASIMPDNVSLLRPLVAIAPAARLTADFAFLATDRLVSVGYADRISVWDTSTGQEIGHLGDGTDAAALCLAIGPDGTTIATGGTAEDRGVRLWDVASGVAAVLGRHDSLLESVAFSPGGERLASGGNDNTVRVWDLPGGLLAISFEGDVPGLDQAYHSLFWLDDRTLLAAGSDVIYSWDVTTGQMIGRLARPEGVPFLVALAPSPAADRLAAVAQDNAVYIWTRSTQAWSAWPAPEGTRVTNIQFSPDGQVLAAATQGGELLLWGVEDGKLLARFQVTSGSIAAVRFSPDGQRIAVGGWDSPIWLWGIP